VTNEDSRPTPDPTILTTAQLDREIAHLKELNNLHLELIERQRVESKADNQRELNAALVAAKENVNSFKETYDTGHSSMLVSIDALRQRVTALESAALGYNATRTDQRHARNEGRDNLALWIAVASVILTVALTIMNAWVVHVGH
jgi:anti-sigma-K factor RskA